MFNIVKYRFELIGLHLLAWTIPQMIAQETVCLSPPLADKIVFSAPVDNRNAIQHVVPGDFNNDGVDDVVLVGSGRYSLIPLISTFAGTFRQMPAPSISGGQNGADWVAAADFTGDGNLDLLVNRIQVQPMLPAGQGDGSFVLLSRPRTSGQRIHEAAGVDINGDGLAELVLTVGDRLSVLVFENMGAGEFAFAKSAELPIGVGPTRLGDFDGDGLADLAAIGSFANTRTFPKSRPDTVVLMRGDGSGAFTPFDEAGYKVGQGPANLAVDDYNVNGKLDVVVVSRRSREVHLFLGDGLGGLQLRSDVEIPFEPLYVDSADLTGNGAPDIVVSSVNSEKIAIFANDGNGAIELTKVIDRPLDGAIRGQPITRLALGR